MSVLNLHFKAHNRFGEYTLNDKYTGTTNGDITNNRKGRWSYTAKLIEADHKSLIIVLDPDLRGRETYYYVRKDGIIQIDNTSHLFESKGDRTLRRY
jgi:hypothetical protein